MVTLHSYTSFTTICTLSQHEKIVFKAITSEANISFNSTPQKDLAQFVMFQESAEQQNDKLSRRGKENSG